MGVAAMKTSSIAFLCLSLLCLAHVWADLRTDEWEEDIAIKSYPNVCQKLVKGKPMQCKTNADCGGGACWACGKNGKVWLGGTEYKCEDAKKASSKSTTGENSLCKDW